MHSGHRYSAGLRGSIARYFSLRDDSTESFANEFIGGLTNYLVCVYVLRLGPILQVGVSSDCETYGNGTTLTGYSCAQYDALPLSFALVAGISTILMGLVAGVPFVLAPGISTSVAFQTAARSVNAPTVLACNIVVGLIILLFAVTSKKTRVIHVMPEDYRLGVAAGIGGLLALIGVRSMNIVPAGLTAYTTTFSYKTILGLAGVAVIATFKSMQKKMASLSFIISISFVTILSVIIRAGLDWTSNDFIVFKYVVLQTVNKLFDMVATVTALILLAVMTKLGYSKDTFLNVLSESDKVQRIYLVDGLMNVIVAPFLGTSIVTPYLETAAGIVVGARTGLASVVTGSLFLISALFAQSIAMIIPSEASGGAILVACFFIIQGLQYVDYERTPRSVPALMAFVLIPFTSSISIGASYSFVVLFAIWALTPNFVKIVPQMVCTFALAVLLLVVETGLVQNSQVMGALLGGLAVFSIVVGWLLSHHHDYLQERFGDSQFDPGSTKPNGGASSSPLETKNSTRLGKISNTRSVPVSVTRTAGTASPTVPTFQTEYDSRVLTQVMAGNEASVQSEIVNE